MKLSDLVLMSDVDGTLLVHDDKLPRRNLEALNRFTQKGGKFALATGRATVYAQDIAEQLPVNFPCVVYNGSGVYDYAKKEYLIKNFLPDTAREYLTTLMRLYPQIHMLVAVEDYYCDLAENTELAWLSKSQSRNLYTKTCSLHELTGKWIKIVMLMEASLTPTISEFVKDLPDVRCVCTNEHMMEMLPNGSTKANAIKTLMELKHLDMGGLVCIGDYYNDWEMIKLANIGVTLVTSPEDIKATAQIVVGPCEDGALADLVERLEQMCGG